MASLNDKITDTRNAARPVSARVTVSRSPGGATLQCNGLTGWPTDSKVHFVTYSINTNDELIDGTQLDCEGIVSGSNITSFTVNDGTDSGNIIGDVVEMLPTAAWGQDLADALMNEHNRDGTHSDITADNVTATTGTFTTLNASGLSSTLLGLIYPVGSIYTNASVSTNPGTLLGFGTWTAFGSGRVLVGVDAGQTEFDTLGETGGAKTHTLTSAEMPVHSHSVSDPGHTHLVTTIQANIAASGSNIGGQGAGSTASGSSGTGISIGNAGSGGAHNNLQPYITVYMWKRTA